MPDLTLTLPDEDATARLGQILARHVGPGLPVLLSGPIGSGKTHLARAFIHERLGQMEDVPSPTFTLVQVYDAPGGEIWHADLYRLTHPDEAAELGLEAAFASAVCLVEWPERLGQTRPAQALTVNLDAQGDGRRAVLAAPEAQADLLAAVEQDWVKPWPQGHHDPD